MAKADETRTDLLIKRAKNHPVLSVLIIAGICFGVIVSVAKGFDELRNITWFKSDDDKVFVSCQMGVMPSLVPPEGRIYVLLTSEIPAENGGGGFGEYFAKPGSEWKFTNDGAAAWAYRCEVTNHSAAVLLNVEMAIHLTFREPVAVPSQPKSRSEGNVTLDRDWPVTIPKIEPSPAAPYAFYVWNCCVRRFVQVSLPSHVRAADGKTVRLVQSTNNLFQALTPVPFD